MLIAATLATIVMLGLGLWAYQSDLARARQAALRGSRIIDTAAGKVEFAERGEGVPILSIHGAGGGWDQGLANVADFIGEGFRVIAPSRFGYLRTPAPSETSVAAQADACASLLSKLHIGQAIVVGVSAGARAAVELAIRDPQRVMALILVVPGTYAPEAPVSVPQDRGSKLVLFLVRTGADLFWWITERLAPSLLVRFVGVAPDLLTDLPPTTRRRVMSIVAAIEPLSWRMRGIAIDSVAPPEPAFDRIMAPTLIISARDDLYKTAPAASFAASRIPDAELILFDTGGHLLVGREDEVRNAVSRFLSRVTSRRNNPRSAVGGSDANV
jgi:pimeloyl-ACP methyl ester carboxylesterase